MFDFKMKICSFAVGTILCFVLWHQKFVWRHKTNTGEKKNPTTTCAHILILLVRRQKTRELWHHQKLLLCVCLWTNMKRASVAAPPSGCLRDFTCPNHTRRLCTSRLQPTAVPPEIRVITCRGVGDTSVSRTRPESSPRLNCSSLDSLGERRIWTKFKEGILKLDCGITDDGGG